ncbi:MAG: chorismate synthase [Bacteroidales bacterium]|nr:chorismate synthase [Bacteroidales bacterium]
MTGNTFGKILKLTTFGESHSVAVGGVLDGFPSNISIDYDLIKADVQKRKTGKSFFESQRLENDEVVFLSGICEGKSLGTPIAFYVLNNNASSKDYNNIKDVYRPSHADFTYEKKFGIRDYRGGGRASARETLARVIGGAFAKMLLKLYKIEISAFVSQIGHIKLNEPYWKFDFSTDIKPPFYFPDRTSESSILKYLTDLEKEGDTVGGEITCVIKECPVGLGEPVFDKLQAQLAYAMMGINAVKGFEFGSGFSAPAMKGSEHNDVFVKENGQIKTLTNFSGGIQGGISNGQDIYFFVAFKPVASIKKNQQSIDKNRGKVTFSIEGRHDVCPVPRAVPIVEAMAALVLADNLLLNKRLH